MNGMKYSNKEEELKYTLKEIISHERKINLPTYDGLIKHYKKEISRLKMKINKLNFQLWKF